MEKIDTTIPAEISISVVSHGQVGLIVRLLNDLDQYCTDSNFEVILTLNIPEVFDTDAVFSFPLQVIRNQAPLGFGANHNRAFEVARGAYFCVVNPDIRLSHNPFPALVDALQMQEVGIAAPFVVNPAGAMEESYRQFPTPWSIFRKALIGGVANPVSPKERYVFPDWVGGMFMLFPCFIFARLQGFDERFYLYYEDVDICARSHLINFQVVVCSTVSVVHEARFSSHRSLRYFYWHLKSMAQFFSSAVFLRVWWCRRKRRSSV